MKILNEKGIIHRDLKPQNILLNRENNDQSRLRVKIGKKLFSLAMLSRNLLNYFSVGRI